MIVIYQTECIHEKFFDHFIYHLVILIEDGYITLMNLHNGHYSQETKEKGQKTETGNMYVISKTRNKLICTSLLSGVVFIDDTSGDSFQHFLRENT